MNQKSARSYSERADFWIFYIQKTYCHNQHFLNAKYTKEVISIITCLTKGGGNDLPPPSYFTYVKF